MTETKSAYRIRSGNLLEGSHLKAQEDGRININISFEEIGYNDVNQNKLIQDLAQWKANSYP
jgi:hypothetical protein